VKILTEILLIVTIFLIICWAFKAPSLHFDKITERKLIKFVKSANPNISSENAKIIIESINKLSYRYKISAYYVLGIIYTETSFKNTYGDHNKALGYGQIHYQTFEWIKSKFPKKLGKINYYELTKLPKVQVELIYMHLYLLLKSKKAKNIEQAISIYNGRKSAHSQYSKKVINNIRKIKEYLKRKDDII
jgi:hypothetical protein